MNRLSSFALGFVAILLCAGSASAQWSMNGNKIFYSNGKVGIGTSNPNSPLQVVSNIGAADRPTLLVKMTNTNPSGFNAAIRGINRGTGGNGIGVWGSQDGAGWGVYGTATGAGVGVYGTCTDASGFDFFASGAGTDYGSASSRRWKSDIVNIDVPLAKLARLRGVYYTWDKAHGGHHDVGMIAEEVGEVLPEIVQYEANGVDAIGMDYSKLMPLLVEAVNALRAEKDAEIAQRDEQIEALGARVAQLEHLVSQLIDSNGG